MSRRIAPGRRLCNVFRPKHDVGRQGVSSHLEAHYVMAIHFMAVGSDPVLVGSGAMNVTQALSAAGALGLVFV